MLGDSDLSVAGREPRVDCAVVRLHGQWSFGKTHGALKLRCEAVLSRPGLEKHGRDMLPGGLGGGRC